MEPIGWPFPSSVTNSSPSPPRVTLDAPTARPIRNSGSTPDGRGAEGCCGRAQVAAAMAQTLTSPRLAQRRVELRNGEIDVCIRVRAGDEARLEGRRRQEHATRERGKECRSRWSPYH